MTWAGCIIAEKIVEIRRDGVMVRWFGHPDHFVAWDGWSQSPGAAHYLDEAGKAKSRLRFDNVLGDYVDPASYAPS